MADDGPRNAVREFQPFPQTKERPKTDEELHTETSKNLEIDTSADQLNRMGELLSAGTSLMVHHHEAEMRDDAREWRCLVAYTETSLVSFCLDLDWVARTGIRPASLIDAAGPWLRSLHLRNPKNGMDQELLRDGDINLATSRTFSVKCSTMVFWWSNSSTTKTRRASTRWPQT